MIVSALDPRARLRWALCVLAASACSNAVPDDEAESDAGADPGVFAPGTGPGQPGGPPTAAPTGAPTAPPAAPTAAPTAPPTAAPTAPPTTPGGDPPAEEGFAYGRVTQAAIAAQGDARCPDFNGGGPDNAFAGVGLIVNPTIVTAIEMQMMNLLPVTIGLLPGEVAADFSLALFDGAPEGAAYRVSADALDAAGEPVNELPATLANGEMSAGPASFSVSIPINNIPTRFRLTNAQTRGRPSVDASGGLSVTGGIISGQLSQPDLDAAFSVLPPEQAALIPVAIQPDLDTNGDGTPEAFSICLTFEATPATVLGYPR